MGRVLLLAAVLVVGFATGAAADAPPTQTPNIFDPASKPAEIIRELSWLVLAICTAIFLLVGGVLTVAIVRFRHRPAHRTQGEPPQVYGSLAIETAWTVIPILIVFILFMVSARTIGELDRKDVPAGALDVTVVGYQWWWEFRYPSLGIVTANELHVPVSDPEHPTPTFLRLESADVIHSFWIPRLAGKTDVVPNRANTMWIEPWEPGLYVGQCAEYCGTQHANMLLRVYVDTHDAFARWVAVQRRPAIEDPSVAAGRELFLRTACINCHTVRGTVANGTFGPDLTHLMSRTTLGAGVMENSRRNLLAWLRNPERFKPGVQMPPMQLSRSETRQVAAYLVTLR